LGSTWRGSDWKHIRSKRERSNTWIHWYQLSLPKTNTGSVGHSCIYIYYPHFRKVVCVIPHILQIKGECPTKVYEGPFWNQPKYGPFVVGLPSSLTKRAHLQPAGTGRSPLSPHPSSSPLPTISHGEHPPSPLNSSCDSYSSDLTGFLCGEVSGSAERKMMGGNSSGGGGGGVRGNMGPGMAWPGPWSAEGTGGTTLRQPSPSSSPPSWTTTRRYDEPPLSLSLPSHLGSAVDTGTRD
jgi:hypothetical protein